MDSRPAGQRGGRATPHPLTSAGAPAPTARDRAQGRAGGNRTAAAGSPGRPSPGPAGSGVRPEVLEQPVPVRGERVVAPRVLPAAARARGPPAPGVHAGWVHGPVYVN